MKVIPKRLLTILGLIIFFPSNFVQITISLNYFVYFTNPSLLFIHLYLLIPIINFSKKIIRK